MTKKAIDTKIKIAPKGEGRESWTVEHWNNAKESGDWDTMTRIFDDRIRGRYFTFIQKLTGQPFSGFAIMALGCALLETLHQFYKGIKSSDYAKWDCGHKMKNSEFYVQFLTQSSFVFSKYFKDKKQAEMFYNHFRCGLLHQAETKGGSKIHRQKGDLLFAPTKDGLIIYRETFVDLLDQEITKYTDCLKNNTILGFQERFIQKMDYICQVPFEELEN